MSDALPPFALPAVTRTTLALFAGASGDHNPIHIDLDHARAAGYDDVFAHGMLSMAWLGRALESWVGPTHVRDLGVRFVHLTHVGDVPTCHAVVREVDGDVAHLDLEIRLADGTVTVTGRAVVDTDALPHPSKENPHE
ncbi:MaoC/PaaZ C-terminal domain-containing protein [Aeromicrobium alkaliterrae]|uniref:MaoC family dehydratase n=1 Tax=Aeromicrobium alkaliterrae TaxID=302168 RepID=A0ABP4W438_9ACTN